MSKRAPTRPPTPRFARVVVLWFVAILAACGAASRAPSVELTAPEHTPTARADEATHASAEPPPAPPMQPARPATPKPLAAYPVVTEPGELPSIEVVSPGDPPVEREKLPLSHTRVTARLALRTAEVEVAQTFVNKRDVPIEALYVFPLPENAAVHRMSMKLGSRTIEGKIERRSVARDAYASAKAAGQPAALLEERRGNVFTFSIANVAPRQTIDVNVRYVQDLSSDAGVYEFVFPMVVGPRFDPERAKVGPTSDAEPISPPYVGKGQRTGADIAIEVIAEASLVGGAVEVVTHETKLRRDDGGLLRVELAKHDRIPNRDFVLRYRVAREVPRAILVPSGEDGYFTLVVEPPPIDAADSAPREVVFVIDVSGSMAGAPLSAAKRSIALSLERLGPHDTFNVISFSGATDKLFFAPRPVNANNLAEALAFVDRMSAGGGTMMLDAIAAALGPEVPADRERHVLFMTDGFVSIEDELVAATRTFTEASKKSGGRGRVFALGLGPSPNRALLEGITREGGGVATYASGRDGPARAVNAFFRYIDRSILRDVSIDWGGAAVVDVTPEVLPDLFASRALVVHGRLGGTPPKAAVLRATSAEGAVEIPIHVEPPPKGAKRTTPGLLWARSRVRELEADLAAGETSAARAIEELGLRFGLTTRMTSFLAIDSAGPRVTVPAETILQPVENVLDDGKVTLSVSGIGGVEKPESAPSAKSPSYRSDADRIARVEAEPPPASGSYRGGCACAVAREADRPGAAAFLLAALLGLLRYARRCPTTRPRSDPRPSS